MATAERVRLVMFPSELGWMAALETEEGLAQLVFGGENPASACGRLDISLAAQAVVAPRMPPWVQRLQAYAAGRKVDLRAIPLALPASLTPFQQRVLQLCREVSYGEVATYGQLAARAGSPRAARAVGNVMAANRVPIVVPCHRVVPAGGQLGRYSAPGGGRTKLRLLEMEGCRGLRVATKQPRAALVF